MSRKEYYIIGGLILISYLLVFIFNIRCPYKEMFGIYCAGCGFTRMIISLLKLDFYQAFRFNPAYFIILSLALLYIIYVLICIVLKKKYIKLGFKTIIFLLILLVIFGILRNINGFDFLKPTIVR